MAIKKADKDRKQSSRNLEDHVVAQARVEEADVNQVEEGFKEWDVNKGEIHSDTKLEHDLGTGKRVVIRTFVFGANPESFRLKIPSKQELFNAHAKEIETELLKDGLWPMKEVVPRLQIAKDKTGYRILVAAEAKFGETILESSKTLTELVHGNGTGN